MLSHFSHVQLFVTPWTTQSMEFSRPESWSGQPFSSPGDLPNPGTESRSPALQADSLLSEPPGKPSGCQKPTSGMLCHPTVYKSEWKGGQQTQTSF